MKTTQTLEVSNLIDNIVDWDKAPIIKHLGRINNDIVIGEYFNLLNCENFIFQINEFDEDRNGVRKIVNRNILYIKANVLQEMLRFPEQSRMRSDLAIVANSSWYDFVFKYTKLFYKSNPKNLLGLRFRKMTKEGKIVSVGINQKNLPALKELFSK